MPRLECARGCARLLLLGVIIGYRNRIRVFTINVKRSYCTMIITRRMHGIVGERERSNCVVDMRCI